MQFALRTPVVIAAAALAVVAASPAASVFARSAPAAAPDPGVVGVTAGNGTMLVAGTDTPFLARGFNSISIQIPQPYADMFCAADNPATVKQVSDLEQYMAANADRELLAMKTHWRANAVRFQVSQGALSLEHQTGASTYTDMVLKVIKQARAMGLVTIVSLNTEQWSCTPRRPNGKLVRIPDTNSVDSWSQIAPIFGHDRGVMLEIFNEPSSRAQCPSGGSWSEWAYGCADGSGIGMVRLGQAVRAMAPDNVLIFDGDPSAQTFAGFTPPSDMPDNSAYAVHPYLYWQGGWDELFGDLQASGHTVIVTEWNESSNCAHPPTLGPDFIQDYLPSHHIGLIVQSWDAPWNQLVGPDPGDDPADSNSICPAFTGASTAYDEFWNEAGNGDPAPQVHVSNVGMIDGTVDSLTVALGDNGTQDCSTGPQVPSSVRLLVRDAQTQQVEPMTALVLSPGTPWTCGSYMTATGSRLNLLGHRAHAGDTLILRVHYAGEAVTHDTDYVVGASAA